MPRYLVVDGPKRHDGKLYGIGAEMEVSEEVASKLRLDPAPPPVSNRLNVREMAKLVEDCATIAEVEALLEGEERKTVLDAAAKKIAALEREMEEEALKAASGNEDPGQGDGNEDPGQGDGNEDGKVDG